MQFAYLSSNGNLDQAIDTYARLYPFFPKTAGSYLQYIMNRRRRTMIVADLFDQYLLESGQVVDPEVVRSVYESTNGQPGLVGWFGELLTEKHIPGKDRSIDFNTWKTVQWKERHHRGQKLCGHG